MQASGLLLQGTPGDKHGGRIAKHLNTHPRSQRGLNKGSLQQRASDSKCVAHRLVSTIAGLRARPQRGQHPHLGGGLGTHVPVDGILRESCRPMELDDLIYLTQVRTTLKTVKI